MLANSEQKNLGLERLQQPILPLIRLLHLLFLTGPFEAVSELLEELPDEIEQGPLVYQKPALLLAPYLDILENLKGLKTPEILPVVIINEQGELAESMEALEAWICHQVITRELEEINSALCYPCGCDLCCVGPTEKMNQDFFEIPLMPNEKNLFPLSHIDTDLSRSITPEDSPPFSHNGTPFYSNPPALYHWKSGWSLILTRYSRCPNLTPKGNACTIYPKRPEVCRRPQIFSYILERRLDLDTDEKKPVYALRNTLLAIWDCPYVRKYKDQIATFAELCQLEPLFKTNKS